ncbi:MAG: ATP-grasp domain-containing protein [Candidatus Eisenbacteria bacterium]|uniref:ATP-grasp domain-containing protein n=1 Tax=Eiseniibacteriota bacterium TaxID=2212470 RepID=A0A956LXX5_UNCEI|nr:ATP-grasp domain-containing protein [Candidatus Eisenbacteria bacterium]
MVHVVFVAPFLLEATLRFVKGAALLPGVRLSLVTQESPGKIPEAIAERLAASRQVQDALDPDQLAVTMSDLARELGPVHRVLAALEQLQVPLAEVRARLGIPGMDVETAHNFRDKSRMKTLLRQSGIPCARHALIHDAAEARAFVEAVGYPVVVKPPAGAGAKQTFRLEGARDLTEYLSFYAPRADDPTLFEEFMTGQEHSFDSVCIRGNPVWYSITRYYPSPLEVMENPWVQWCVILPREVEGPEYADIRRHGSHSLRVLGLQTGLTHMEWFRRPDGGLAISEVAARPPGAQFTTLISYAHDLDFYKAWPRLLVHEEFDPPERSFAAGAVFLRGQGEGKVKAIHGVEQAQKEIGSLVVEAKLPRPGQPAATGYEGEGYVIVRHPETALVEQALARVLKLIRVELG